MRSILFIFCLLCVINGAIAQQPLFIPDTISSGVMNLQIRHDSVQFYPGAKTQTMGINGAFLAPTLLLNRGEHVQMHVQNQLTDTTTIHWHGLHVSPANDGGPHIVIPPGTTWSPNFTVLDWASTYWYHPHLHYKTTEQVAKGVAGFIIVRDSFEAALNLPRTYGFDDIPLLIQTRQFNSNNQIVIGQHLDTAVMLNGTLNPVVSLPAQMVRLRLLNGSLERVFNIGLSTNESFHMIGSDGGLLQLPVSMTRLQLAPGERAEILVNLIGKQGQSLHLVNYGSQLPNATYGAAQAGMGPGQQLPGYSQNPRNGANFNLLLMQVGPACDLPVTTVPATLVNHQPFTAAQADTTRIFTFMPANMGPTAIQGPFMINNAHFEMHVINEYVPFNNIEIWELRNQTPIGHPFHLHDVPFYVLSINGAQPPIHLRGRKDVIFVPAMATVRFITQFETFWDDSLPYMYHCHMLTHEDDGMMGQFIVKSPLGTGVSKMPGFDKLVLFPNPANNQLYFRSSQTDGYSLDEGLKWSCFDVQGRKVLEGSSESTHGQVDVSVLSPGMYVFEAKGRRFHHRSRFLISR
jgi:blue copper oxidase